MTKIEKIVRKWLKSDTPVDKMIKELEKLFKREHDAYRKAMKMVTAIRDAHIENPDNI